MIKQLFAPDCMEIYTVFKISRVGRKKRILILYRERMPFDRIGVGF